jgi:peptidoglycan/LPS O-acetylase OafA/YrhL
MSGGQLASWYVKRAERVVPITNVVLSMLWIVRWFDSYSLSYAYLGGARYSVTVLLSYLSQPGCVGGMWFLTVYAQCVIATPFLSKMPERLWVMTLLLAVMVHRNTVHAVTPVLPTILHPCDADGLLFSVTNVGRVMVHVASGLCVRLRPKLPLRVILACLLVTSVVMYHLENGCVFVCVSVLHVVTLTDVMYSIPLNGNAFVNAAAWFGRRSYSIYMGHVITLAILIQKFTVSEYIIPYMCGMRVFVVVSCTAGVVVDYLSRMTTRRLAKTQVRSLLLTGMCVSLGTAAVHDTSRMFRQMEASAPSLNSLSRISGLDSDPKQTPPSVSMAAPTLDPIFQYAFFTLIRGGRHMKSYDSFRKRCTSLVPYRNAPAAEDIAFHEGNVPPDIMEHFERKMDIRFVNVHDYNAFSTPPPHIRKRLFPVRLQRTYPIGYRHMCRLFAIQWMHILTRYKVVMRVDEDVIVHHMESNPFTFIERRKLNYAYPFETEEFHKETVLTFQPWVESYMRAQSVHVTIDVSRMFFTNVFITSVSWWLQDDVQRFLRAVDESGNIYLHRWGDAPIQTSALKIYSPSQRIALFKMDYTHTSTSNEISNGKEIRYESTVDGNRYFAEYVFKEYDRISLCLVAKYFGVSGEGDDDSHTLDTVKGYIMLETGVPDVVFDYSTDVEIARIFQFDVKKSDQPLPPDTLNDLEKLDHMAKSLGRDTWSSDHHMLGVIMEHPCYRSDATEATRKRMLPLLKNLGAQLQAFYEFRSRKQKVEGHKLLT